MKIELLYFEGCPGYQQLLPRLRELAAQAGIDQAIELTAIQTPEAAERARFLGSPTVRVDGKDIDPGAHERDDFGLKCRLYQTSAGLSGIPADEWILDALTDRVDNPG